MAKSMFDALLVRRARELRKRGTYPERILWYHLAGRQLDNFKFRRQAVLSPFIADFLCKEARLIIEIDGDSHSGNEQSDLTRQQILEDRGYLVLRFTNDDVLRHTDAVLAEILRTCKQQTKR